MSEPLPTLAEIEALEGHPTLRSAKVASPKAATPVAPAKVEEAAKKPDRSIKAKNDELTRKLPVMQSLAAVEAFAHVPKTLLSEIRKRNCAAFDSNGSGRVDCDLLFQWMFKNLTWLFPEEKKDGTPIGSLTWKGRTERANAILREIAAAKAQEEVVKREEVTFAVGRAMAMLFSSIDSQFSLLLPPTLKGLDESGIQQRLMAASETFKQAIREELKKFVDVDKPK